MSQTLGTSALRDQQNWAGSLSETKSCPEFISALCAPSEWVEVTVSMLCVRNTHSKVRRIHSCSRSRQGPHYFLLKGKGADWHRALLRVTPGQEFWAGGFPPRRLPTRQAPVASLVASNGLYCCPAPTNSTVKRPLQAPGLRCVTTAKTGPTRTRSHPTPDLLPG